MWNIAAGPISPEDDFIQHEDLPYAIGEFVWTGFDYLGEPTPYYANWPSHSSLFGIVDLAGIPKDRFYLYRSHWNKDEKNPAHPASLKLEGDAPRGYAGICLYQLSFGRTFYQRSKSGKTYQRPEHQT